MRAKPSTDEPSNQTPSSRASSNPLTGISTLFTVPVTSVNCNEMNLTPSSFTRLTNSLASIFLLSFFVDWVFQLLNADNGQMKVWRKLVRVTSTGPSASFGDSPQRFYLDL